MVVQDKMTFQLIQRHKQECKTPDEVIKSLKDEFGELFDPCPLNPKFDGLNIDWEKRVYVNPPYSNIPNWLQKAHSQMTKGNSELVIFLLPVDTSTRWFHDYILGQAEIRFIKGRLRFTENKPAPFASMIVIFKQKRGRKIFSLTLGDIRGLKECGYLSKKGLKFLEEMEEDKEDKTEP